MQWSQLGHKKKAAYYLLLAKLRLPATVEQIESTSFRSLTKQHLATLIEGRYFQHGQNLLITEATRCGENYLTRGIDHRGCLQGCKTICLSTNRLIEKIMLFKLDGTYIKLLNHLERQSLIILDDFGLQDLGQNFYLTLLQLLENRREMVNMITKAGQHHRNYYYKAKLEYR